MGKAIYFTREELVELELAVEFYGPQRDPDDQKTVDRVAEKLASALE